MFVSRLMVLTLVSMCALSARVAYAQPVALDLTACDEPRADDVRAIAALELRGRLVQQPAPPSAVAIRVRCADDRAELESGDPADARVVDLGTVPPPLRARLLALAIAELARVHVPPPRVTEPPVSRPASVTPPVASRLEPIAAPRTRWAGWVGAGLALQPVPLLGLAGVVSSLLRVTGPFAFGTALELGQTRRNIDRGELRVRSLGLRSGPALQLERGRFLSHAGVGARLTLLSLAGQPDDRSATQAARFRTFTLGPTVFGGVSLALARHLMIALEAELSHQLRELRAEVEGGRTSTLSPWRVAIDAMVGVRW